LIKTARGAFIIVVEYSSTQNRSYVINSTIPRWNELCGIQMSMKNLACCFCSLSYSDKQKIFVTFKLFQQNVTWSSFLQHYPNCFDKTHIPCFSSAFHFTNKTVFTNKTLAVKVFYLENKMLTQKVWND